MTWNFNSFNLNHSITALLSVWSVQIRFSIVLSAALIILSSAKCNRSVFVIQRYGSFINILKRNDQIFGPWGSRGKTASNTLWGC